MSLLGERSIDCAVLDIWLHGQDVFALADLLVARRVPIIFMLERSDEIIPPRLASYPRLLKPLAPADLVPMLVSVHQSAATSTSEIVAPQAPSQAIDTDVPYERLLRAIIRTLHRTA